MRSVLRQVLGGFALAASLTGTGCVDSGRAPVLEDVDDLVVAVGQELVVNLRATDPDGDALTFTFASASEGVEERGTIAVRPDGTGVFRWTPLAADVETWAIDFTVSDGENRDTVTAMLDVRATIDGSAPVFREPLGSGTTLDLERADCLELAVVVEDQDDATIMLGQEEPLIEGATLMQETGASGQWTWCPSKAQLIDDRFPLVLSADDETNPKTLKNYLVVLRHPPRLDCPGGAPVIEHEPADPSTVLDIQITARISDDVGLRDAPILYYSTVEPKLPVDFSQLDLVEMDLLEGDAVAGIWSATIPNPVAGQDVGASAPLYYIISAADDDDTAGNCDHVTESPSEGAFAVTVTNPGGKGGAGLCEPCSADVQCGEMDDLCVLVGTEGQTFCLTSCETNDDCGDGYACVEVGSMDGSSGKQCAPVSGVCEVGPDCLDDAFEENDTRAQAESKPPLMPDTHEGLVACANDDDWYRVVVGAQSTVGALLEGGTASNLNLGLYDGQGNPIAQSTGAGSSEVIEECVPAGTYYLRVYGSGTAKNTYDLLYEASAGSCTASCIDDDFEEDDSQSAATYAEVFGTPFSATDRMLCSGDDDWYEIALFTGETVEVDLTFDQTSFDEDLDLHFHDVDGLDLTPCTEAAPQTCSAAQGQSATSNEHFEFTLAQSGCFPCTFYVRVHGFAGAESPYAIALGLQ